MALVKTNSQVDALSYFGLALTMRFFVLQLLFLAFSLISSAQSAHFFCENRSFDFGTVPHTQEVRHVFTLASSGTQSLVIGHVQSCCGIKTTLSSTNIPFGKQGQLELVFYPSDYSGKVRKTVYLHTNDPEAKIVSFRITGNVIRPPSGTNILVRPPKPCCGS